MIKYYLKKSRVFLKKLLNYNLSLNELVFSYIHPNYTILEAGAHNGTDTIILASLTKNKVYAFEPIPHLFEILKKNTSKFNNVSTYNIALADVNRQLSMYVSSGGSDASSSLMQPAQHLVKNPEVVFNQTITVEALTLDSWALKHKIKKIDFMWLDMQGFEFNMLKESNIIFPTVKILYTEVSTAELYKDQCIYTEYKEWLFKLNFKLVKEDLPWGFTGNALFVRS